MYTVPLKGKVALTRNLLARYSKLDTFNLNICVTGFAKTIPNHTRTEIQ